MKDVLLYDTTLRDGCQAEDVSFTLEDKLRIAEKLDELGIGRGNVEDAGCRSGDREPIAARALIERSVDRERRSDEHLHHLAAAIE